MSDSVRPQRRQPTRLPRPWDSPGKNTGVGCHFLLQCMKVKSASEVAQSCPTERPRGLQPTRLPHPWDFPGKSTGVRCHCLLRTLRIITPVTELWPFWTLSLMPMVLGLPFCGIFHIPSPFGSSQKCSVYCFWVVLVPSLTESLPHICTDRTQPKTHRGPCGDLQSASSVESPLCRTPPCKFLALWFPWHTTIFLFDLAWFG